MMDMIINIVASICLVVGVFFVLVGSFGVLRMPELFTRIHAASVTDTLGAGLILIGFILLADNILLQLKLFLIVVLFFITSPTSVHALAKAALHGGITPKVTNSKDD